MATSRDLQLTVYSLPPVLKLPPFPQTIARYCTVGCHKALIEPTSEPKLPCMPSIDNLVSARECSLPSFRNPVGADNESPGCRTHKIERVAGYQGEEVVRRWSEHLYVFGLHNLG